MAERNSRMNLRRVPPAPLRPGAAAHVVLASVDEAGAVGVAGFFGAAGFAGVLTVEPSGSSARVRKSRPATRCSAISGSAACSAFWRIELGLAQRYRINASSVAERREIE